MNSLSKWRLFIQPNHRNIANSSKIMHCPGIKQKNLRLITNETLCRTCLHLPFYAGCCRRQKVRSPGNHSSEGSINSFTNTAAPLNELSHHTIAKGGVVRIRYMFAHSSCLCVAHTRACFHVVTDTYMLQLPYCRAALHLRTI